MVRSKDNLTFVESGTNLLDCKRAHHKRAAGFIPAASLPSFCSLFIEAQLYPPPPTNTRTSVSARIGDPP